MTDSTSRSGTSPDCRLLTRRLALGYDGVPVCEPLLERLGHVVGTVLLSHLCGVMVDPLEVDQNRVGRTWRVVLRQNGTVVRRLTRVTRAPSGSFEARMVVQNRVGVDRRAATASRRGETCRARGSF